MREYKSYLVTLRPLTPFLFGGEHNLDYGTKRQMPQRYYISSEDTPAQTTLFGTLRYAVLAANQALITKYGDSAQIEKTVALVGEKSFDISEEEQRFGVIDSISPLFLIHHRISKEETTHTKEETVHRLIPLPTNHSFGEDKTQYIPCGIKCASELQCNQCSQQLYAVNRDIKFVHTGWLSLKDRSVIKQGEVFSEHLQVGINAHRLDAHDDMDDSFFKKSKLIFKNAKDCFAFYATMTLNKDAVAAFSRGILVAMGQNQAPFILEAVEEENKLEQAIKDALGCTDSHPFYYAFSDAYLSEVPDCFFIADTKPFRFLKTDLSKVAHTERLYRTTKLYRLFSAGAVFYGTPPEALANCKKIGLNHFIKIGGKSK